MLYLKAKDQLEYFEHGFGFNIDYEFPYVHTHDYWEFVFTVHDVEHYINGKMTMVHPHTLLIIKPEDTHFFKAPNTKNNPNKEPTHLNIKVSKKKLEEITSVFSENVISLLESCNNLSMQIDGTASLTLEHFISVFMWSTDVASNLIMLKTSLLLILNLFHPIIFKSEIKKLTLNPEVEDVIKKMNSQKYLASSVNLIADESNYSYMQLTRIFKKEMGLTMHDYFINVKMQYASSQLRLTNRLIVDISNDIGITSLSHFNHVFKKRYGITPGQYRDTF